MGTYTLAVQRQFLIIHVLVGGYQVVSLVVLLLLVRDAVVGLLALDARVEFLLLDEVLAHGVDLRCEHCLLGTVLHLYLGLD